MDPHQLIAYPLVTLHGWLLAPALVAIYYAIANGIFIGMVVGVVTALAEYHTRRALLKRAMRGVK